MRTPYVTCELGKGSLLFVAQVSDRGSVLHLYRVTGVIDKILRTERLTPFVLLIKIHEIWSTSIKP